MVLELRLDHLGDALPILFRSVNAVRSKKGHRAVIGVPGEAATSLYSELASVIEKTDLVKACFVCAIILSSTPDSSGW